MQGLYIKGRRPTSKKQVKEAAANEPDTIEIEATSVFSNEYSGDIEGMPVGEEIYFVGPDPYTKRNFYGTLTKTASEVKVK